jgi:hypothetical protein
MATRKGLPVGLRSFSIFAEMGERVPLVVPALGRIDEGEGIECVFVILCT